MFTPMQPIYLPGHTRPVRQVLHNEDGDLLFSCSDDGYVCVYDTYQCFRSGMFNVSSAVNSIDVTKNSQYVLATAVDSVHVLNVKDGTHAAKLKIPGLQKYQVKLSYGDKQFFVLYKHQQVFYIAIYDLQQVLNATEENAPKAI